MSTPWSTLCNVCSICPCANDINKVDILRSLFMYIKKGNLGKAKADLKRRVRVAPQKLNIVNSYTVDRY